MLGALLLVGQQLAGDAPVLLGRWRRAAACRRSDGGDAPAADGEQRLGARAGDLEVAEVQEVHVGARVDVAQAPVDRERLDRDRRGPALRGHDLEGVAGVDVLDDARDHRLEALARHVGLEGRGSACSASFPARPRSPRRSAPARRAQARTSAIVRRARCVRALAVGLGLEVGVGEDRDRVLEVVEGRPARRSASAPCRAGRARPAGLAERLDGAHEVVAEVADGAAGERRHVAVARIGACLQLAATAAAASA